MPDSEPILTIGIPTWNRASLLRNTLTRISAQLRKIPRTIEVLVSDNASDDNTVAMLKEISPQFSTFRYIASPKNIGPDRNFLEVFRQSFGRFVWLFGDDDYIADNAILEILSIIDRHDPDYISTNYHQCDSQMNISDGDLPSHSMIAKDVANVDLTYVFKKRKIWLSFMSSNVFKRDRLNLEDYSSVVEQCRNWIQVYIAADLVSQRGMGYLSCIYAVNQRGDNNRCDMSTYLCTMPAAFNFICTRFSVDSDVRQLLINEIRKAFLPFRMYLVRRARQEDMADDLVPNFYKLGRIIPNKLVLTAWRAKNEIKQGLFGRESTRSL